MEYVDYIKDYEDYDKFIDLLNHKKCYISYKNNFYKLKPYLKGFSRKYKVTAVHLTERTLDEYWYTDDLFGFIKDNFINLYIEKE